ncbi:MAG: hypothetical protein QOF61_413, partial [Acidobacteriota bacterium]|nr:hypothetical protein [Acidobacteriota bacterium]
MSTSDAGRRGCVRARLLLAPLGACVALLLLVSAGRAQQPFVTDNADVTDKGKLHLQIGDEFDLLQRTLYPAKTQNTLSAELDYGLCKNVEVGFSPGLLSLHNARLVMP